MSHPPRPVSASAQLFAKSLVPASLQFPMHDNLVLPGDLVPGLFGSLTTALADSSSLSNIFGRVTSKTF